MRARRARTLTTVLAAAALVALGVLSGRIAPPAAASAAPAAAPAAVKAFDEAGVSTGLGDGFTPAQWTKIRNAGFRLFMTDPVDWSSECSDDNCTAPVSTCTVDPAAVAQIQDAMNAGVDYAVYTRNP